MGSSGTSEDAFSTCGESALAKEDMEETHLTVFSTADSKCVTQAENERNFLESTELDVRIWSALDDDVLEMIFAKLPFKSMFRVPSLSKTWRLTFHSDSFRRDVRCSMDSWKCYAPVLHNGKKDFVGYESSSKRWHRLPTHSYLPQAVGGKKRKKGKRGLGIEAVGRRKREKGERGLGINCDFSDGSGSLLWWTCEAPDLTVYRGRTCDACHIIVTNPLTKSWKQLPPRPDMHYPISGHGVLEEGSKTYKLILCSLEDREREEEARRGCVRIQVFDSAEGSWTTASYPTEFYHPDFYFIADLSDLRGWGGSTVINGVLYMLVHTRHLRSTYELISWDVKNNIRKGSHHLYQVFDDHRKPHRLLEMYNICVSELLVCGANVMLVINHFRFEWDDGIGDDVANQSILSVYKLDLELGLAFEVSRAPDEMISLFFQSAVCHGDCIYVGTIDSSNSDSYKSIVYNVGTQEWHWFDSEPDFLRSRHEWRQTSFKYQPGLNPFLEV